MPAHATPEVDRHGTTDTSFLARLERTLEARHVQALLFLSALYWLLTGFVAGRYSFFYDEFFTFHIAKLGDFAQIIEELRSAAEFHPPLDFLIRGMSMSLFGTTEFAERLPSLIGFWLYCLCLYVFVRRRCTPLFALIAFLAPSVTYAYEFSYWGRSYGILLAASGLSLVAWQALTLDRRRAANAVLLWLGLTICVTIHYYGVFAFVPVVAGETYRAISRKKIDWLVVGATFGSLLMLSVHFPFLGTQLRRSGVMWSVPSIYYTSLSYWWHLKESVFVIPIFLFLLSLSILFRLDRDARPSDEPAPIPGWEIAAAASLLWIPFICYLAAKTVTNAFHYRYTLLTISGVIILGIYALQHGVRLSRGARVSLLIAFMLGSCYEYSKTAYESIGSEDGVARRRRIESLLPDSGAPIVCGSRSDFLSAVTYGTDELRDRMFYLVNMEASRARIGNDSGQWSITNIAHLLPGHVVQYDSFLREHDSFILVDSLPRGWFLPQLLEDGALVSIKAHSGDDIVMSVEMRPGREPISEP